MINSQNPFDRKELYAIKAPSMFATRNAGKTLITKTIGTSKKILFDHKSLFKCGIVVCI
jgi:ribosomal protein S3AE